MKLSPGYYVFTWRNIGTGTRRFTTVLTKNTAPIGASFAFDSDNSEREQATNTVIAPINKGDIVRVRIDTIEDADDFIFSDLTTATSTFSGYRLGNN